MDEYMLSTVDNPFNPFTDFNAWWQWDTAAGYHTAQFLARIIQSSDELSEADQAQAYNDAIDEIIAENITGMYIKVTPTTLPRPRQLNR